MSEENFKIKADLGLTLIIENSIGESRVKLVDESGNELIHALIILDEFHGKGCIDAVLDIKNGVDLKCMN